MQRRDVEGLARIASGGDLAALNVLLVAVRPEVLRLCTRMLSNREDAEEACQDTLLAVAQGLPGFEGRSAFRTWLYRLAANRARSTYRRSASHRLTTGADVLSGIADTRRTSVVAITRRDLLDAMGHLTAELAEAVALADLLGLSYGEIAVLQQVPEGTVKSRIHKARRQLRKRLGPDGDTTLVGVEDDAGTRRADPGGAGMSESSGQVTLQPITSGNRQAVEALRVLPEQENFVDGVASSLTEAAGKPHARPWYRGIYADGLPVGFVMLADGVPPGNEDIPWPYYLWRLLIDARFQGRGYGRAALDQLLAYLRTRPQADLLVTSVVPGDGSPLDFYLKYGFRATGQMFDREMVLHLPVMR